MSMLFDMNFLLLLLLLRVPRFILTGAELPRWEKSCRIKGDK